MLWLDGHFASDKCKKAEKLIEKANLSEFNFVVKDHQNTSRVW